VPKNEDGEFELILGNRQLLSVFFIVVVLLGVFFTMGYIVGRNSSPSSLEAVNSRKEAPPIVESTARPAEPPKPPAASGPIETAPQKPPEANNASEAPTKATPEKETAAKTEAPKPAVPKTEAARTESKADAKVESQNDKASKSRTPAVNGEPVAGQSYLQLAATSKHEADIMVDVLRNKGFKSIASEIAEKPGTFRVLVGPIAEGGTNKMRADLQASGFPGNAALRRVF
jgi:type IV secretory pathway VirB10-like protein